MNWLENLKLAADALWVNRLRSLLTMLGLIIGISSVIRWCSRYVGQPCKPIDLTKPKNH